MTTPPETQDRLSPIPLRERLAAHCLIFDEDIDRALVVFRDWLREQAAEHEKQGDDQHVWEPQIAAMILYRLADAIDKELNQ